jgi:hypothetical protein
MIPQEVKPSRMQTLPRGVRVILYFVALTMTIMTMAGVIALVQLALTNTCGVYGSQLQALCSSDGRPFLLVLTLVLVAANFPWLRFLLRTFAINEKELAGHSEIEPIQKVVRWPPEYLQLRLGQSLVTGRVDLYEAGHHRISVNGLTLRFWGGYALYRNLLQKGENAAFVYQRDPFFDTNFVLAFWKGGDSPVRAVGQIIHSCFFVLAIITPIVVSVLKQDYPGWIMPVCYVLFGVSFSYLLLCLAAKRALRSAIDN